MFPVVKTGPQYHDVLHLLMDSASRRSTRATYWEGAWPFTPIARFHWTADEVAEHLEAAIPADAWLDLAEAWLQPARTRLDIKRVGNS